MVRLQSPDKGSVQETGLAQHAYITRQRSLTRPTHSFYVIQSMLPALIAIARMAGLII